MTDLIIRGGTVVTATGSRVADVAVADGRIVAIEADLSGPAAAADEVIDATGLLVLPGRRRRPHPHARRDRRRSRTGSSRIRSRRRSAARRRSCRSTTRGPGSSPAAERSLLTGVREWRAATDGDSAIDYGLSLAISGHCGDPLAELPATIESGVATSKAFMVFDFRLPDERLFEAMRVMADRGGMLQVHCEDPVLLDAAVAASLQRGDVSPRYHATTRPSYVEAVATARALAFARMADAPVHVVHLSSAAALDEVRRAKAAGVRVTAETCPHYLVLTEERYDDPDPVSLRPLRHLAAAPLPGRPRRAVGRPRRRLARPRRHRPRRRPPRHREGRRRGRRPVQRDQQRRAGHRDAPDDPLQRGRREGPDHRRADGRPPRDDARRAASGSSARARSRSAATPTSSCSTRPPAARSAPPTCTTRATTRRTRASRSTGAVRDVFVRGRAVIRDGAFVGRRGAGAYVERGPIGD